MLEDVLPKTQIKQTICSQGVEVFIKLLKRERLDVCLAAKQFNEQLGLEGITGSNIKGKKTLSIKLNALGTTHRVEEIEDSDDDGDVEDDDDNNNEQVKIMQSQARLKSAPAASLRQTTLPKLFKAIA